MYVGEAHLERSLRDIFGETIFVLGQSSAKLWHEM